MTVKTLSAVAVRVIGWLVILQGITSSLSSVLFWMMRAIMTEATNSSHPVTSLIYLPLVTAVIVGLIELGVGFSLIQHSEFFGRILCKGIDERL